MLGIDLYTALKITGTEDFDSIRECVYLRRPGDVPADCASKILTMRACKEKYDMRKTKVIKIEPYFVCDDYQGMLFTLAYE